MDFGRFQEAVDAKVIYCNTEVILLGLRKQSVGDVERLLSYAVADLFKETGCTPMKKILCGVCIS